MFRAFYTRMFDRNSSDEALLFRFSTISGAIFCVASLLTGIGDLRAVAISSCYVVLNLRLHVIVLRSLLSFSSVLVVLMLPLYILKLPVVLYLLYLALGFGERFVLSLTAGLLSMSVACLWLAIFRWSHPQDEA